MNKSDRVRDRVPIQRDDRFVQRTGVVTKLIDRNRVMVRWDGMEKARTVEVSDLELADGKPNEGPFRDPFELTPARCRLLELLAQAPMNVRQAAAALGTTVSAVQSVRQTLRDCDWIEDWKDWIEPMRITEFGRIALEERCGDGEATR